ncbi:hypothetical protein BLOT_010626 [Blomia tropicalis]|nr:hypothetical protein BLOT_010626 [Blomia tropicalis]
MNELKEGIYCVIKDENVFLRHFANGWQQLRRLYSSKFHNDVAYVLHCNDVLARIYQNWALKRYCVKPINGRL